jgi:transposase-like protein
MNRRPRRNHTPTFKAKVALAALKGANLGSACGAVRRPPNQITSWKASQGVDKHLADRARKAAAMTEKQFEAVVARAIKISAPSGASARSWTSNAKRGYWQNPPEVTARKGNGSPEDPMPHQPSPTRVSTSI